MTSMFLDTQYVEQNLNNVGIPEPKFEWHDIEIQNHNRFYIYLPTEAYNNTLSKSNVYIKNT